MLAETLEASTDSFKQRITESGEQTEKDFWSGADVESLVHRNAQVIDDVVVDIWQQFFSEGEPLAILAVGGYGRGELHPNSDIDILILVKRRGRFDDRIAALVRFLWDLNLKVGHSVRTPRECRREAVHDLTVATSMFERRHLAGSEELVAQLDKVLDHRRFWPSKRFFEGKRDEQNSRHDAYGDVEYGLEPNVKNSPGGLRDLQTILWICQRHFRTTDVNRLKQQGVLTTQEVQWIDEGKKFLWKVRFGLHLLAKRAEDQLFFDHQRELANRFGYRDSGGLRGVEQFMLDYYRQVLALREVNDILFQHFDEVIAHDGRHSETVELNERFRINDGYIEIRHPYVFRDKPAAIMEMFVIMANRTDIQGVRAETIRSIRNHLDLIDDDFRHDPEVTDLFMQLLRAPYTVVSQLTRIRRYGVLGRYIPEFGNVIGQMQHDLFHIYTVDAHTFMVIRFMRRFSDPNYASVFPLANEVVALLPKKELLYIAGLYHDIGKGRGGNHSDLGAEDVVAFCHRHGLDADDTELVEWLVRDHLTMSSVAQRQDIDDPAVIAEFAERVKTEERLNYLFTLTVADINGTNSNLWTSWRDSLMRRLYRNTLAALRRGQDESPARTELVNDLRNNARDELIASEVSTEVIDSLWDSFSDDVFLHHSTDQIVLVAKAVEKHPSPNEPLVVVMDTQEGSDEVGGTEVFVCAADRDNLFADIVVALDQLDLQICNATIDTGTKSMCYDSFIVLDQDNKPVADLTEQDRIRQHIQLRLKSPDRNDPRARRRVPRSLKQFVAPTEATLTEPDSRGVSRLTITSSDRPGLLALIGTLFIELDIEVHQARITTLGERVEDVFDVSSRKDPAIDRDLIVNTLRERIDSQVREASG